MKIIEKHREVLFSGTIKDRDTIKWKTLDTDSTCSMQVRQIISKCKKREVDLMRTYFTLTCYVKMADRLYENEQKHASSTLTVVAKFKQ